MLVFPSNPSAGDRFGQWMWDGGKWTRAGASSFTLESLADVELMNPDQGQALVWNATVDKWVNATLSPGTLATLLDVAIAAPSAGALLTYDGTRWVSGTLPAQALAGLSDVALIAAGVNGYELLRVNPVTGKWENGGSAAINADANQDALMLNAVAGHVGLSVYRQTDGTFIYGRDTVTGVEFRLRSQFADWFSLDVNNAGYGFSLNLQERQTITVGPNGNVNIYAPVTGNALTISQLPPGQFGLVVGDNTSAGTYMLAAGMTFNLGNQWVGSASEIVSGQPNGLAIGTTYSTPVMIWTNGQHRFYVSGAGTVTVNPPDVGHTALQVMGGFSPTSVASFQAIGGVNGPGLYINMTDTPSKVSLIASGYNIPGSFALAFANGEVLNFGGGTVATFSAPYVQVPNMASTGVTGLPYVVIDGNGNLLRWGATSSLRYKTNIHSVAREQARAVLSKLRAITYTSTIEGDDPERVSYGLIAEEVAEVDSRLVHFKDGKPESVIYERVAMLLLPLMQELLGLDEPEGEF